MTDTQIEKVLAEGLPIAAVLLARGGWLRAEEVRIVAAFPAEPEHPKGYQPAVWKIELAQADAEAWHAVFIEAANIVGISVSRDSVRQHETASDAPT